MNYKLAIDIGASSGRGIIGWKNNDNLQTEEIYRFKNNPVILNNHITWDINNLVENVKETIRIAFNKYKISSLSIDTWGVDYVLMNNDQEIMPCYCYRDLRTKEVIEKVHKIISFDNLYRETGCQFQTFNTIYQLYDDLEKGRLENTTSFLMIPEYLIYKLTGKKVKEFTNAT